eukprot:gene10747-14434_t
MNLMINLIIFLLSSISTFNALEEVNLHDEKSSTLFNSRRLGIDSEHLHSNIIMNCTYGKYPICCDAINGKNSHDDHLLYKHIKYRHVSKSCKLQTEYFSSPYELAHIEKAKVLDAGELYEQRKADFFTFIYSYEEKNKATKWLKRVAAHMVNGLTPNITQDDEEFLSKFVTTKICSDSKTIISEEWIEPLTVHGRHPLGLSDCKKYISDYVMSVDYVLTKSGLAVTSTTGRKPKNFLFDAGTTYFYSSLSLLYCFYSKRALYIDELFGWEYKMLDHSSFWSQVPHNLIGRTHFFNIPCSSDINSSYSPLHVIKRVATKDDFVSFKLDIDTPNIELPIAMQIASDPDLAAYIDEFFFELHFRCEGMMSCGWGYDIPEQENGLKLRRYDVMMFFKKLRNLGVRAHMWV